MVPGCAPECKSAPPDAPQTVQLSSREHVADKQYPKWQKSRRLRVIVPVSCSPMSQAFGARPARRGERSVPKPNVGDRGIVYVHFPTDAALSASYSSGLAPTHLLVY